MDGKWMDEKSGYIMMMDGWMDEEVHERRLGIL
jgi:hypothetical protein